MIQTPAIEIANLMVKFDGKRLIKAFSMCLSPGEKVTLTGRSGSGKSTILRCLLGFVVPEAGTIHIAGKLLTNETVWELRIRLAYVAQEPDLGTGRVQEIIERPFTYRANSRLRENLARIPEFFERFLLPVHLLDKEIATLSGGEKQRVGLITAILLDRRILLLDEVSSALDKTAKLAVAEFFRSRKDMTVLSVSHSPKNFSFSDRVIELPYNYSKGKQ